LEVEMEMNMKLKISLGVLVALALSATALAGCKKEAEEPEPEETTGAELPPEPEPEPVEVVEMPCELQTVYFAFDSSELDGTARATIQEAVECFRDQNPEVSLLLTGACDPRGTEEYNIALGDRRAVSVRDYMRALGLDSAGLSTRSVGEELATGTDEATWAKDRNVSASED
jgi:peptidoglycan-associated lipoprotein